MNKEYTLESISDIAKEVLDNAKHKTILFYGEMGVGKTTLIKELCLCLGVDDITHSPTFSLVNEYHGNKNNSIFHFDFYRINNEEEVYDIGIEDYLYSNNWCFIEWPENIKNLLPLDSTEIQLSLIDSGARKIQLKN
ncbi:MAG: tRNA (adenosine(37)-N6)-threonylcarbamoyltransferase complex ATPase subunit type 1 TsaE [Flavobacteriaceae bacterium]